jgi:hypothetical protein
LRIGNGFERLTFFSLVFIILIHCVACIMVVTGQMMDTEASWIEPYKDLGDNGLYTTALYFATSTITTVGYGDISGQNVQERLVNIIVMLFGVMAFSFMTGALSSILQNVDSSAAMLEERMSVARVIQGKHCVPLEMFEEMIKAIKYDLNRDNQEINNFVQELPHQLKLQISMIIFDEVYNKIKCFKGRKPAFIAWVCPLLKPCTYTSNCMIFADDEDIAEIFFLTSGKAGFVLPRFNNTCYIQIAVGQHFGVIDIAASIFTTFDN